VRGVKSLLIGDVQERIEKYSFKAHYTPKRASADHSSEKSNITTIIMWPTSMGRIKYCIFSVCLSVCSVAPVSSKTGKLERQKLRNFF